MRRILALLLALLLFSTAAACGGDDGDSGSDDGDSASASSDDDDDEGDIADMEGGGFDLDLGDIEDDDLSNEEVIENVEQFWDDNAEDIGLDFERLDPDRVTPLPTEDGETDGPLCGGIPITAEQTAQNTYASTCPEGLAITWDPELLDGHLTDLYGEAGPAVVFAHEFGHIIQYQTGIIDPTGQGIGDPPSVITENQADCFAGAWVAEQVEDGYGPFEDPATLDDALGAMIEVRDPAGVDPNDPLAHGNGFDRVRAFQDGVDRGIEYCFSYIEDEPPITELPFTEADLETQGNAPFDDVVDLVIEDLDYYYEENVDGFESPGDPFDVVPEDDLRDLHEEIGDGAVATVFGMIWAQAAQDAAGDDLDGEGPLLQRACLVGSWLGDILDDQADNGTADRPSQVQLSPGDLDEAIITFLKLTREAMSDGGTAFEAIGNMRTGVFGDIDDCRLGE